MGTVNIRIDAAGIDTWDDQGPSDSLVKELFKYGMAILGGAKPGVISVDRSSDTPFATGTITCGDSAASGDTVVVAGTTFTMKPRYNYSTVSFSTIVADNVVTVNGTAFTAKVSATGTEQFALGASDTAAMTNFCAKVNAHPTVKLVAYAVDGGDGTCTIREVADTGVAGVVTLAKTGAPITLGTLSATKLTGGYLSASSEVPGAAFEDVASEAGATYAADLAEAINAGACNAYVSASASAAVVTLTALSPGAAGNLLTLTETGSTFTRSGATFTGGASAAVVISKL